MILPVFCDFCNFERCSLSSNQKKITTKQAEKNTLTIERTTKNYKRPFFSQSAHFALLFCLKMPFFAACLKNSAHWLPDATKEDVDKNEVDDAIKDHHLRMMKLEMTTQAPKKLTQMSQKDLRKGQDYCKMKLEDCRIDFRLDTKMFKCGMNMKSRYVNDLGCRAIGRNRKKSWSSTCI